MRMVAGIPCGTTERATISQSTALDGRKIQQAPAMSIEGVKELLIHKGQLT